jgi:Fe-S oxidoreductase
MIDKWAQLASIAPSVANGFNNAPGINFLLRKGLGLAPQRQMPQLATGSFQQWAKKHRVPDCSGSDKDLSQSSASEGREVILWADTFNNYYRPGTSQAAYEVLTDAGFNVRVPQKHLCCGRPLYDFGMLDRAKIP